MKQNSFSQTTPNILSANISFGRVSFTECALFAKHLSVMLKSGMTVTNALQVSIESSHSALQKILRNVLRAVESGRSLSDALAEHPRVFSELFVSAVYAGETSGSLIENLNHVARELDKEKQLHDKIKSSLMYPIVVLIAAFCMGLVLAFFVLPKITPLFEGLRVDLPLTTRLLISFSHSVQNHGAIMIGGLVVFIIVMAWVLHQKWIRPVTHFLLLHFPVIKNLVRHTNLARFCRTLGILLHSGLSIDEALRVTERSMSNYYYRSSLHTVNERVLAGSKLSENLEAYADLYPPTVTRMITVGETSGNMSETLTYLADFYESEVDTTAKTLSTAIEPLMLIGVGVVVGFLALSIITPIYSITGNI